MTQLTVNLDDELLLQARETAIGDHASINDPVRDFLTGRVQREAHRLAAVDALDALAEGQRSSVVETWTREESHQRTPS